MTLYRPVAGRRIHKPDGALLSDQGEPIKLTPYWRRLLRDCDIEVAPSTTSPRSRKSTAKAEKAAPEGSTS